MAAAEKGALGAEARAFAGRAREIIVEALREELTTLAMVGRWGQLVGWAQEVEDLTRDLVALCGVVREISKGAGGERGPVGKSSENGGGGGRV